MSRGVQSSLLGAVVVAALTALAGCSHYFNVGEREAWRHDAEVSCLNTGAVKDTPQRVRISAISGPGMCGADFPIRVSALGESGPLGYDDEALRPPGAIPDGAMPQHWPIQSNALPPPSATPQYSPQPYGTPPRPSYAAPAPRRMGEGACRMAAGCIAAWQMAAAMRSTGSANAAASRHPGWRPADATPRRHSRAVRFHPAPTPG